MTEPTTIDEDVLQSLGCHAAVLPLCRRLWRDAAVETLLLFGSHADGSADPFSDVDLWVSVAADSVAAWKQPDLADLLTGHRCGLRTLPSSTGGFVHSVVLEDATIIDLCVLPTGSVRVHPPWKVIAARAPGVVERITTTQPPAPTPASAEAVLSLLEGFDYPEHLEAAAEAEWQRYLASRPQMDTSRG